MAIDTEAIRKRNEERKRSAANVVGWSEWVIAPDDIDALLEEVERFQLLAEIIDREFGGMKVEIHDGGEPIRTTLGAYLENRVAFSALVPSLAAAAEIERLRAEVRALKDGKGQVSDGDMGIPSGERSSM